MKLIIATMLAGIFFSSTVLLAVDLGFTGPGFSIHNKSPEKLYIHVKNPSNESNIEAFLNALTSSLELQQIPPNGSFAKTIDVKNGTKILLLRDRKKQESQSAEESWWQQVAATLKNAYTKVMKALGSKYEIVCGASFKTGKTIYIKYKPDTSAKKKIQPQEGRAGMTNEFYSLGKNVLDKDIDATCN